MTARIKPICQTIWKKAGKKWCQVTLNSYTSPTFQQSSQAIRMKNLLTLPRPIECRIYLVDCTRPQADEVVRSSMRLASGPSYPDDIGFEWTPSQLIDCMCLCPHSSYRCPTPGFEAPPQRVLLCLSEWYSWPLPWETGRACIKSTCQTIE